MIIVGKQGCPKCKTLRTSFPNLKYIEIPDIQIGMGDTICAITCLFGIHPCAKCRVRQHWCNKLFPYKWNLKEISPEIINLKQRLLMLRIKEYPVVMDDTLKTIIPIDNMQNMYH